MPWRGSINTSFRLGVCWYEDPEIELVADAAGPFTFAILPLLASFARKRGISAGAKVPPGELARIAHTDTATVMAVVEAAAETELLRRLREHRPDLIHVAVNFSRSSRSAVGKAQRARIIQRDRGVCGICDQVVAAEDRLEIDHIRPVSRGGSDEDSNLQVAHFTCNRAKAAR